MASLKRKVASQSKFLNPAEFKLVCRVCLKSGQVQLQSIFAYKLSPVRFPQNLTDQINICSGLSIEIGDGFPGKICGKCFQLLTAAYTFRTLIVNSDAILKSSLLKNEHLSAAEVENKSGIVLINQTEHREPVDTKQTPELQNNRVLAGDIKRELDSSGRAEDGAENGNQIDGEKLWSSIWKCPSCDLLFKSAEDLKDHKADEHAYDYCYGCDEVFMNEEEREVHQKQHCRNKEENDYLCGLSPGATETGASDVEGAEAAASDFEGTEAAATDIEGAETEMKYHIRCSTCGKSYLSKAGLRYHIATAHKGRARYRAVAAAYREHRRYRVAAVYEELRRYPCQKCGKRFLSLNGHHYHTSVCKGQPSDSTRRSAKTPDDIDVKAIPSVRRRTARNTSEKKRTPGGASQRTMCDLCGQVLSGLAAYRRHMERHTGEYRWYTCERCPFKTRQPASIHTHRLRHDGLKPFVCSSCPYRTDRKNSLTQHEMAHAGDLRHSCKLCPFRSVNTSNLKRHMTKHTKEKPHQCSLCDKAYVEKHRLTEHMAAAHEGLKKHACTFCDSSFATRTGILNHTKKMHPGVSMEVRRPTKPAGGRHPLRYNQ